MYDFECLTTNENDFDAQNDMCRPFLGGCYPEVEGCCGPDCSPN